MCPGVTPDREGTSARTLHGSRRDARQLVTPRRRMPHWQLIVRDRAVEVPDSVLLLEIDVDRPQGVPTTPPRLPRGPSARGIRSELLGTNLQLTLPLHAEHRVLVGHRIGAHQPAEIPVLPIPPVSLAKYVFAAFETEMRAHESVGGLRCLFIERRWQ